MAPMTLTARDIARRLPDEFVELEGAAAERVGVLVSRYWGSREAEAQAELRHALTYILEELANPGAYISVRHRDLCEALVASWLARS